MAVDKRRLPDAFPTHSHDSTFWEQLGRVVATFGFLEEVLAKAIFAFTATRPYDESQIQEAFDDWLPSLERVIAEPLGGLITSYGKAVREHPGATITNLDDLLADLRKAAEIRIVLCHGSWSLPDANGKSVPFYVGRRKRIFDTAVDGVFLTRVQRHAAELASEVVRCDIRRRNILRCGSQGRWEPLVAEKW